MKVEEDPSVAPADPMNDIEENKEQQEVLPVEPAIPVEENTEQ